MTPPSVGADAHEQLPLPLSAESSADNLSSLAVADGLCEWLRQVDAVDAHAPSNGLDALTKNCVGLCRLFSAAAPAVLADKDYFVPNNSATNFTRQRRYNTRRLGRSLAEWFGVGSRANSPVNGEPPVAAAASPLPLSEKAKLHIKAVTDAARAEGDCVDNLALRQALAELVLFAAVNCEHKKHYVQAVLACSTPAQEALAYSIKRTASGDAASVPDDAHSTILAEVRGSSENSAPPVLTSSAKKHTADLLVPRGVPHVEFKAIAEERDNIRKRLSACESEKNVALERAEKLEGDMQAATDKLRELHGKLAEAESQIEERNGQLSAVKSALRDVNQNAEEVERLRAKAASAEKLEDSLKRASARLEEMSGMRDKLKAVEDENATFRSNEEHLNKRIQLLESQLEASNEQVQSLLNESDKLSSDLEAKTGEVRDVVSKNHGLEEKLAMANSQLTELLMQPNQEPTPVAMQPPASSEIDQDLIAQRLAEEVGVKMTWADIVECIRGVVEAMQEMDEMNREDSAGETAFPSPVPAPPQQLHGTFEASAEESDADGAVDKPQMVPGFDVVDSAHSAERGGQDGDLFDYAVDHPNVAEIPAMNRRPSLSTVPEDREGFEDEQDDVPEPDIYLPTPDEPSSQQNIQHVEGGFPILSNNRDVPSVRPAPALHTTPTSSLEQINHTPQTNDHLQANGLVRQTRSDVPVAMPHSMDALRMERETNTLATLIQQASEARESAENFKTMLSEKERECDQLRSDLDSLIKEHDAALCEQMESRKRHNAMLHEKERMISLLQSNLETKQSELNDLREQGDKIRKLTEALRVHEIQAAEATNEHTVKVRAQEIEIARLTAKLEASELIAGKLSAAVENTNGLTEEIHRERETYLTDMTEAAKREKQAAEEARLEAERMAATHQRAVADMKMAQAAAAAQRPPSVCCSDSARKHRRSHRISQFWRRVLHLESPANTASAAGTVVGPDARMQAPHPALQGPHPSVQAAQSTGGSTALS